MKYKYDIWTIKDLIELVNKSKIDLKPSYQRNYIWGKNDKSQLITSILKGYPLPSFFVYEKTIDNNTFYEMVDGQQRSKTMIQFYKKEISDTRDIFYSEDIKDIFLNYELNITVIFQVEPDDSLETYYALLNKSGKHLNTHELNKATYYNSSFLSLVESIVESSELNELNIFTEASKKRMNDRGLVEELVATLVYEKYDKRKAVELLYKNLEKQEARILKEIIIVR